MNNFSRATVPLKLQFVTPPGPDNAKTISKMFIPHNQESVELNQERNLEAKSSIQVKLDFFD